MLAGGDALHESKTGCTVLSAIKSGKATTNHGESSANCVARGQNKGNSKQLVIMATELWEKLWLQPYG